MATRLTRAFGRVKAVFGKEITASREEFNKLVDEVEELKSAYKAHAHTSGTVPIGTGTGAFSPAFATVEAKKVT